MNCSRKLVVALVALALAVAPALAADRGVGAGKPGGAGNARPAGGGAGVGGGGRPQAPQSSRPAASPPPASRPAVVSPPSTRPAPSRPPPSRTAPALPPRQVAPPPARTQPVSPPVVSRPSRERNPSIREPARTVRDPARNTPPRSDEFARTPKVPSVRDRVRDPIDRRDDRRISTQPVVTRPVETAPFRLPSNTPPDRSVNAPYARLGNDRPVELPRPSERVNDTTKEVGSIPKRPTRFEVAPPLERFDRSVVPPTAGTPSRASPPTLSPPVASSEGRGSHHRGSGASVDCGVWFNNPCNRFVCWNSCSGFQFGYVFCGSSIYWYWQRPGCSPYFAPYSYYWRPSCYYLPAYCPSYATVRYVDEYWDDGAYYTSYAEPSEPDASEPARSDVDAGALLASGWEQFRAGAYLEALVSFRQSVLANPDDPQAKVAFAQGLFAIGNYADAAFLIRRSFELLPDWPVTGEDPRARYADPADHAEQLVALRGFLERVPGDPAATLVLAVQNYFTGDLSAAREAFSLLAALDPEDLVAKRFLERLGPAPTALPAEFPAKDGR